MEPWRGARRPRTGLLNLVNEGAHPVPEYYIGLMSGTSMDAVDAALVDLEHAPTLLATHRRALPEDLRRDLRALAEGDRKSVVSGKSVELGDRRIIKKKTRTQRRQRTYV